MSISTSAVAVLARHRVEREIALVAPSIDGWLRRWVAATIANDETTPDELFCIADSLTGMATLRAMPAAGDPTPAHEAQQQAAELQKMARLVATRARLRVVP